MRVEALVEQRPESRNRNPAQHTGVHVEERRRCPRLPAEKRPLHQEQSRVRRKEDGNKPHWAEPGKQPSRELCGADGQDGCTGNEVGKALNREEGQEESIADGVPPHLLCDERRRSERRGHSRPGLGHGTSLPICPSSRVARTLASSYS